MTSCANFDLIIVESCKRSLTDDKKLQASVDWLTEVIRRFSEAALAARPFTAVNMKNKFHVDKVRRSNILDSRCWSTYHHWLSGRSRKYHIVMRNGPGKRLSRSKMLSCIIMQNFVLSGMRLWLAQCRKLSGSMVTGKSDTSYLDNIYHAYWIFASYSQKLGEQHKRIKEGGEPSQPVRRQYRDEEEASNGQRVGLSDDETSIVAEPASKIPTCGACRIRESTAWWKAPKGLSSSILCESCGLAWRKYADLNLVRQPRDESLSSNKTRSSTNDKREGTPLVGSLAKRPKVNIFLVSFPWM